MTHYSIFATGAVTAYYSMYMSEVGMFKVFCAIAVPQLEGRTSSPAYLQLLKEMLLRNSITTFFQPTSTSSPQFLKEI
jgi:hypothetical protein